MHNLIILGAGRSGTSMVAGAFSGAGYFQGDDLHGPQPANPKGYFESPSINALNEEILEPYCHRSGPRRRLFHRADPQYIPRLKQYWLAHLSPSRPVQATPDLEPRIRAAVSRAPYCYKDPRFCYSLSAWQPFLDRTRFICVFREPEVAVESTLENLSSSPYYQHLSVSRSWIYRVWRDMYDRILNQQDAGGDWLFVHYRQVLAGLAWDRLESFSGALVNRSFADPGLDRTRSRHRVPRPVIERYRRLCGLANYHPG